jgi:hypothetical protein
MIELGREKERCEMKIQNDGRRIAEGLNRCMEEKVHIHIYYKLG